jgi:hypothetical protein
VIFYYVEMAVLIPQQDPIIESIIENRHRGTGFVDFYDWFLHRRTVSWRCPVSMRNLPDFHRIVNVMRDVLVYVHLIPWHVPRFTT